MMGGKRGRGLFGGMGGYEFPFYGIRQESFTTVLRVQIIY